MTRAVLYACPNCGTHSKLSSRKEEALRGEIARVTMQRNTYRDALKRIANGSCATEKDMVALALECLSGGRPA